MYCCHCGKRFDEHKIEAKQSSLVIKDENGELIEVNERGANNFARGMALNLVGLIIGILAFSFLLLSFQNDRGVRVLNTGKSTFLIFIVMAIIAVILLGFGIYFTVVGILKRSQYSKLLKDLNNKTFVQ